jgi:hypothetical protein
VSHQLDALIRLEVAGVERHRRIAEIELAAQRGGRLVIGIGEGGDERRVLETVDGEGGTRPTRRFLEPGVDDDRQIGAAKRALVQ